ncbi:MAG: cytochrome c biogenesis protein/redoxin, partial [Steroidobacteraceae bacterium]
MALLVLAYLGGLLTILSPCVLPVLPFVFARAGRPFASSVLPMLVGMALTFAAVATLAAVGGGWVVQANESGRIAAMVLLTIFGVLLLWPRLAEHLMQPFVAVGNRLSQSAAGHGKRGSVIASALLGVAVGFLWAPCAGPILGLILTGAALEGANAHTSLLLLTYAAGAATSLALALLVGGRVLLFLRKSLGAGEWVRRGLGVAVLAAVAAIALGLDTGLLTRLSLAGTSRIEQTLLDEAGPVRMRDGGVMAGGSAMSGGAMRMSAQGAAGAQAAAHASEQTLPVEGQLPALSGAVAWLNSPPLTPESLRGKVVLVDFWT